MKLLIMLAAVIYIDGTKRCWYVDDGRAKVVKCPKDTSKLPKITFTP